jgi:general secretion pathway protein D
MKKILTFYFYVLLFTLLNVGQAKSEIAFSFDNVNLVSVMNILSEEIKRNIIIDNDIEANISLIINHPLDDKKIISALQSSLSLNDLALFEKENGDILIKDNNNVKIDAPVAKSGMSGFQIFIVRLKQTDPTLMANFLSQFFPDINSITPSPNAKSITFIGNDNDYKRLVSLIKSYDVKPKMLSSEIKLNNSSSLEVFNVLNTLLDSGNWLVSPRNDVSITNIEKLNSIYVSAPQKALKKIQEFILDFDKVAIEKEEDLIPAKLESIKTTTTNLSVNRFGYDVINLKFASSSEIQETISNIINNSSYSSNDNNSASSQKISIEAYSSGNQVILSGLSDRRKEIINLIEILDKPTKQVFVEAVVAELSTSKAKELGLQFSGSSGKSGLTILNSNSLGANVGGNISSFVTDGIGITLGPGANQISSIGALINIIENDGNSEILATPTLLAMNNKEAQILVGSNIPIITGKYTSNSSESANTPFQTISRQDVGIIFKIKPVIGLDEFITIEILQEVSELDTSSALASDVVTTKRAISTSAIVKTGKTLAIGGLINETTQYLGAKLPILGDLPGFKEFFNQRRVSRSKRNLVIFLKPTIVNSGVISKPTLEKYMKLKTDLEKSRTLNPFNLDYPPLPILDGAK